MTLDANDPLAELRLEFTTGLPDRLEKIRGALAALLDGFSEAEAEQFHIVSHSLVGIAATFEAQDVARHARALAHLGRRWRREATATGGELQEAEQGVGRLDDAIRTFVALEEDGAAGGV